jgi:peptidoglycan/LPS O-acetylase OafA/YrhL
MSSGRTLPPRLPKRKDIQSLRALAIVLVISAHAHIPGMQGGYIGVDVFFVLSGYLISGLILTEIENSGRFNALAFYARRLKRLLPALLVVLLSVAGIAWLLASPQQQGGDAEAAQAATLWLSNFYFAARVINYFSAGLGSNLFLHTWSLAVEEQFYLAWPWLVLFLLGAWRWQKRPLNRNHLTVGLALVGTSSLAAGAYWAQTDIPTAFYLMPGRAWEFSLGALTFILRQHCATGDTHAWPPRLLGRSVLNAAGLLMILLAACTYDDSLRYPGLWALLPTIGTALILLDIPESNPSTPLSKLLLQQPVLWFIGNISYSLYLWHWPVLILGGEIFGQGWITRAVLIALSVTLATVTYVLVERPIHQARLQRPFRVLVPSAIAMAAGFIATNAWQNSLQHLMQSPAQTRIEQATLDMPKLYRTVGCDTWYHSSLLKACSYFFRLFTAQKMATHCADKICMLSIRYQLFLRSHQGAIHNLRHLAATGHTIHTTSTPRCNLHGIVRILPFF